MKADRELLELAAKAIGVVAEWDSGKYPLGHVFKPTLNSLKKIGIYTVIGEEREGPIFQIWDPLTDDGDALRLAVKLELKVMIWHDTSQPKPWLRIEDRSGRWTHSMVAEFDADPYAATRRAITRAAASMVKE